MGKFCKCKGKKNDCGKIKPQKYYLEKAMAKVKKRLRERSRKKK